MISTQTTLDLYVPKVFPDGVFEYIRKRSDEFEEVRKENRKTYYRNRTLKAWRTRKFKTK